MLYHTPYHFIYIYIYIWWYGFKTRVSSMHCTAATSFINFSIYTFFFLVFPRDMIYHVRENKFNHQILNHTMSTYLNFSKATLCTFCKITVNDDDSDISVVISNIYMYNFVNSKVLVLCLKFEPLITYFKCLNFLTFRLVIISWLVELY